MTTSIETLGNKYSLIAALLSEVLVIEMTAMRAAAAADLRQTHDLQNEKCRNLRGARDTVEAVAAGYAGCDEDEPHASDNVGSLLDSLYEDLLKTGTSVVRVGLPEMFKMPEFSKAPPPENKAETAAFEAKMKAETAAGTSIGGSIGGADNVKS